MISYSCQQSVDETISLADLDFGDYERDALINNQVSQRKAYYLPSYGYYSVDSTDLKRDYAIFNGSAYKLETIDSISEGRVIESWPGLMGPFEKFQYDSFGLLTFYRYFYCYSRQYKISYSFNQDDLKLYQIWNDVGYSDTTTYWFNDKSKLIKKQGFAHQNNRKNRGFFTQTYLYENGRLDKIHTTDSIHNREIGVKSNSETSFLYKEGRLNKVVVKNNIWPHPFQELNKITPSKQMYHYNKNGLLDSVTSDKAVIIYKYK